MAKIEMEISDSLVESARKLGSESIGYAEIFKRGIEALNEAAYGKYEWWQDERKRYHWSYANDSKRIIATSPPEGLDSHSQVTKDIENLSHSRNAKVEPRQE